MKKYKASDIAHYFVKKASGIDENDLTNLKLQKLLYFAQGTYLAKEKRRLFEDQIEAWKLGPVVKSVYNTFKQCGSFPISVFDIKYKARPLTGETEKFLDKIWDKWGKYSARYLVDETHKSGTPWRDSYIDGGNNPITDKRLATYFKGQ